MCHMDARRVQYCRERDPFDRMLVAQAMAEPMFLVTSDRALAGYGDLVRLV